MKYIFIFVFFIGLFTIASTTRIGLKNLKAAACGEPCVNTAACTPPNAYTTVTCSIPCSGDYCVGINGTCSCTTSTSTHCPPGAWGPWGACSDGYQIRFCSTWGTDSQIQACGATPIPPPPPPPPPPPTTPPGPGATPIPTSPPATATPSPPTCTISLSPATTNLTLGGANSNITATVSCTAAVDNVTFSSSNTGVVSITTNPVDTTSPYTATVHGVSTGTVTITGTVYSLGLARRSATATVNVASLPCSVTTSPASLSMALGGTGTVSASVTSGLGSATVSSMAFGSYDTSRVTVSPASDSSSPYTTTARSVAQGSASVWATATLSDGRTCQTTGTTDTDITVTAPTCTISLSPATTNLTLGGADSTITATVSCTAPIDNVTFSSSNSGVVSITSNPVDSTSPYTATVHGVSTGAVIITGRVSSGGGVRNSATAIVNSTPLNAWFQMINGDLESGGGLSADIPPGELFNIVPPNYSNGFPGIPAYRSTTNLTQSNTSSEGWLVQNTSTNQRIYNYQSLVSQIPADTIINSLPATVTTASFNLAGTTASYGYKWYRYTGNGGLPLTINGTLSIGSNRVILLVDSANLQINGPISVTNGVGFFMVLVGKTSTGTMGNITVASSVGGAPPQSAPNLEGIYEADGTFNDSAGNNQLWVRGSVVAHGGASLQRDLVAGNATYPAELFEFAPDQIILYPTKLGIRKLNWKEVAP